MRRRPYAGRRRTTRRPGTLARLSLLFGDGSAASTAQFRQAAVFLGLVLFCTAMAFVHLGSPARALFALAGLVGAYVYGRRSPWLLLTWTFWLWAGTPCVRRLIEWHSGFNGHDPILALPNVALLFMAPDILLARGLLRRGSVIAGLGVLLPIAYGLINSLFRGDVSAAAFASADWVMPLVCYFFVAVHGDRIGELQPHLRSFLAVSTAVIVPYSLYQYLFMTPWDQFWLDNSGLVATNQITDPTQNRVFGPFNNPGFLAIWVGWILVMMGFYSAPVTVLLAPLAVFLLIVTLSRSVYLSTGLGFVMLLLVAPPKNIVRQGMIALFAAVVVVGLISVLNPGVEDTIEARFASMTDLSNDTSANVRRGIWAETPAKIAATPLGEGIGAVGRSADLNTGGGEQVVDSGVLGPYLAFGWLFGSLYLFSMMSMTGLALIGARRARSREAAATAAAAVVIVGITPFLTVNGFPAALLWTSLAIAAERTRRAPSGHAGLRRPSPMVRGTANA